MQTSQRLTPGVAQALRRFWASRATRLSLVDELDAIETRRNRLKGLIDDYAAREQDAHEWLTAAAAGTALDGHVDELLANTAPTLR